MLRIITGLTLALSTASPLLAQDEPAYLDDRSTGETVISSYYNAINRSEYTRAYAYFGEDDAPEYDPWEFGYSDTGHVEVQFGETVQEGAAGSTFWSVPVRLDVTSTEGAEHWYFAGCYTLRLVQPLLQEMPPFRPLHIVEGHLDEVDADAGPPATCD